MTKDKKMKTITLFGALILTTTFFAQNLQNISSAVTNVSCAGFNDGKIEITVPTTSGYRFQWNHGPMEKDLFNLYAGEYRLMITDSMENVEFFSFLVGSPKVLYTSANVVQYYEFVDVNLTVNGGTAPYTFDWSNGVVTQNLDDVMPGQYEVIVVDSKGCSNTIQVNAHDLQNDVDVVDAINVFPNPSFGDFTMKNDGLSIVNAVIYNSNGQIVSNFSIGQNQVVEMNNIEKGNYYLHSTDSVGKTQIKQVVVK